MHTLLLLTLLLAPFQAQAKPTPAPSLTGKWAMAIDIQGTTATPSLELVQEGEKITGNYAGRYGKFQLTGTLKGRALVFTFTMNAEGTEVLMTFKGEVAADFQSMKGEADMAGAGEASWSAKRVPAGL
jgi:hypothetical protein